MLKPLLISIFIIISNIIQMEDHTKNQFIYEIKLFEQFKHKSKWQEKEHQTQKQHLDYLDSLTKEGVIEIAGIQSQGLTEQKGVILLTVKNYEEAHQIAMNDPSVKEGMMTVSIYSFTTYFKKK